MKIAILSDLHLEFEHYNNKLPEADVLILAGDILPSKYVADKPIWYNEYFFNNISSAYKKIFYVPGNHEFYGSTIQKTKTRLKYKLSPYVNLTVLDDEAEEFDGINFIGSTLWTNFNNNPLVEVDAAKYISDFGRAISDMTVEKCKEMHNKSVAFIEKSLKEKPEGKNVVITHFTPSWKSIHPKWGNDPLNLYFSNNLNDLVSKSSLWIHGHTHSSMDYMIDNTRVICNPKGYRTENKFDFNPDLVVEI